eukprot:scaffold2623_cov250-Pinguiococcus_pyrenoidosus.AAC.8
MGVTSVTLAILSVYTKDREGVLRDGFFFGYTGIVWAVVFFQALGGLVVAFVTKYANTILKCFATAISIVCISVISVFLFNTQISLLFAAGAILAEGRKTCRARGQQSVGLTDCLQGSEETAGIQTVALLCLSAFLQTDDAVALARHGPLEFPRVALTRAQRRANRKPPDEMESMKEGRKERKKRKKQLLKPSPSLCKGRGHTHCTLAASVTIQKTHQSRIQNIKKSREAKSGSTVQYTRVYSAGSTESLGLSKDWFDCGAGRASNVVAGLWRQIEGDPPLGDAGVRFFPPAERFLTACEYGSPSTGVLERTYTGCSIRPEAAYLCVINFPPFAKGFLYPSFGYFAAAMTSSASGNVSFHNSEVTEQAAWPNGKQRRWSDPFEHLLPLQFRWVRAAAVVLCYPAGQQRHKCASVRSPTWPLSPPPAKQWPSERETRTSRAIGPESRACQVCLSRPATNRQKSRSACDPPLWAALAGSAAPARWSLPRPERLVAPVRGGSGGSANVTEAPPGGRGVRRTTKAVSAGVRRASRHSARGSGERGTLWGKRK